MARELAAPQRGQHDAAAVAAQHRQQAGRELMDVPGIVGVEGHEAAPPEVGLDLAELRPDALHAGEYRPPMRLALRPEGRSLAAELQAAVAMMHADARQQAA